MQSDVVRLQNELKAVREAYKGQISKLQQQKVKEIAALKLEVQTASTGLRLSQPERNRLNESVLAALQRDDVDAVQRWISDPHTHIDDTEPTKNQTVGNARTPTAAHTNIFCVAKALIWSARHGSTQCMRALISCGANLNATMDMGATALYLAAQQGLDECVQMLVEVRSSKTFLHR